MASILTNTSAMTALQTLRTVSGNLETTQDRISTGKRVNDAKDNAAYWSIATTMSADVAGFEAVSDSLELGSGTTNTASTAATNIVKNLETLKARIISGMTEGVDASLIQDDIDQLVTLVKGAASDASFNGDNLLAVSYSSDGTAKDKDVHVLSSLSRSGDTVVPSYISFDRQDLQVRSIIGKATIEQEIDSTNAQKASIGIAVGDEYNATTNPKGTYIDGENLGLDTMSFTYTDEAGVSTNVSVDLSAVVYTTDEAGTQAALVTAVQAGIDADLGAAGIVTAAFDANGNMTFTVNDPNTDGNFTSQLSGVWVTTKESDAFGGLAELTQIDVENNAAASLTAINKILDTAIAKASVIGSVQTRVESQAEFVTELTDAMTTGIGALVDADMNEESSRLQALQVQQQLAIQALSIANQEPQNILSLFK